MDGIKVAIGVLADTLADIVSDILPRKTFDEVVEKQNTRKVSFFRVHNPFGRTYIYGKRPGEPLVKWKRHHEGVKWPQLKPEQDESIIGGHFAKCTREKGSEGGLCSICRKLNNPKRREFLVRLYKDGRPLDQAGFNVGEAKDKSVLNMSATSVYLRHLAALGLIRREQVGRIVTYVPDICAASPCVREIAEMMRERWRTDPSDTAFVPVFRVMMRPFRAGVVRLLAAGGCGTVESLMQRFHKKASDLIRELDWAVKAGLLDLDSEDLTGEYHYITPADPIARRIIELS